MARNWGPLTRKGRDEYIIIVVLAFPVLLCVFMLGFAKLGLMILLVFAFIESALTVGHTINNRTLETVRLKRSPIGEQGRF